MVKRKAKFHAAEKHSKTPKKNLQEQDFSTEFSQGEDVMKGFNRNSKKGTSGGHAEKKELTNVEFGHEIFDINGSKFYEVMTKDKKKGKK